MQACHIGERAFAIQFHPEVTYAMMCRWTVHGHDRMSLPGALPRQHHLDGWFQHDGAVARWTDAFLGLWISRGAERPRHGAPVARELAFAEPDLDRVAHA